MCKFDAGMNKVAAITLATPLPESVRIPIGPRVLLVEDDPRQRALLSDLLGDAGYHVTAVGSATGAMAQMSAHFDLLITDVDLESLLTGLDIARFIRLVQPDLPVLVLSARDAAEGDWIMHLRKPCTSGAILSAVQKLVPSESKQ